FNGGGADVFIIQPDADGAAVRRELGGGVGKLLSAAVVKVELHDIPFGLVVPGHGGFHILAGQDLLAVGRAALAEDHVRRGADRVDGALRVKVGCVTLPGETHDDTVEGIVDIVLVIGDAETDKAVFNDGTGRHHLFIGRVHIVCRHERHV